MVPDDRSEAKPPERRAGIELAPQCVDSLDQRGVGARARELREPAERVRDAVLGQQRDDLLPDAFVREPRHAGHALPCEALSLWIHAKAEPILIANRAEDSSRIVLERSAVEDADRPGGEVG